MGFTEKQLDSYIALHKKEFHEDIDRAEALRQATSLVNMVRLVYKPMTKADYIKYSKIALEPDSTNSSLK